MRAHCFDVQRSLPIFPPMPVFRPADTLSKPFLVATRVKQENSAELAKQMVRNLPDDHGVFDTSNHLCATTADLASFHVNVASGRLLLVNTRFNL
jgi:hypothetical protein